jgi:GTP cyclohydrolase I
MASVNPTSEVAENTLVSPEYFNLLCSRLAEKIDHTKYTALYPVPKNGMYVAHVLSKLLNLPVSSELFEGCLVVDDLIDSGRTLSWYSPWDTAVLIAKNGNQDKVTYFVETRDKWITFFWEDQQHDIQNSIVRILEYIGENPMREGLRDTPDRVVRSWKTLYGGYNQKAEQVLGRVFEEYGKYDEMVILKDIDFFSTCEHHMLPFTGKAHIAYLPKNRVVGISKLARLVEMHARRLQIQEKMTADIADDLERILQPWGVAVLIEGQHFCITSRGVQKINAIMVTSKLTGAFKENPKTRQEFMALIKRG